MSGSTIQDIMCSNALQGWKNIEEAGRIPGNMNVIR
jgi:hypothetical protein